MFQRLHTIFPKVNSTQSFMIHMHNAPYDKRKSLKLQMMRKIRRIGYVTDIRNKIIEKITLTNVGKTTKKDYQERIFV